MDEAAAGEGDQVALLLPTSPSERASIRAPVRPRTPPGRRGSRRSRRCRRRTATAPRGHRDHRLVEERKALRTRPPATSMWPWACIASANSSGSPRRSPIAAASAATAAAASKSPAASWRKTSRQEQVAVLGASPSSARAAAARVRASRPRGRPRRGGEVHPDPGRAATARSVSPRSRYGDARARGCDRLVVSAEHARARSSSRSSAASGSSSSARARRVVRLEPGSASL